MKKFHKYNLFHNLDENAEWLVLYWWISGEIGCPVYSINKAVSDLTTEEQEIYEEFQIDFKLHDLNERKEELLLQPRPDDLPC